MRFRAGPLKTAAILAAVFVATRVAYRVVFGGASGSGALLLDLPRIPLAGPFGHIALFGPVTAGGLWNAALSALPFAAVILAFGLLNAVFDVRRLFVRGATRGPLRAISRSLVIAWASIPALVQSARRVRRAAALRGERGAAALLIPVFEQTIERALALAASMEVRGFAASHPASGDCEKPVVMTDAALTQGDAWRLEGLDLALAPGTLTLVVGATGSGKSSLLRSMNGLFQHFDGGTQEGRIAVAGVDRKATPPRETARLVGSVAQNVRLSFAAETVADEIGFSLAAAGVAPVIVADRVREVAGHLGISPLLDRSVTALSAGEATLVAIAAAVVARPILLLVDEPLAELDRTARATVCAALDRLAHEAGVAVVIAEHRTNEWARIADTWLEIRGTRVLVGVEPPALPAVPDAPSPAPVPPLAPPVARVHGLGAAHDGRAVVHDVSLTLAAGEIVALEGPNGAGKSSLLHAMALPQARGVVLVGGLDTAGLTPRARRRAVALVPEEFDELFVQTTVAAECRRADRRDRPTTPTASVFAGLLGRSPAATADLLLRHPRDLSAGERLCLAIAIQLAPSPAVLLVDEPARGLDADARALVGDALRRTAAGASGANGAPTAVLFATHDTAFSDHYATRRIRLEQGRLAATPAAVPT